MKIIIKLLSVITAAAIMAVSLSSCSYLDALKAHQCFYTDDTKREISYKEDNFKILKPGSLSFIFTDIDRTNPYYVTKSDVPVLVAPYKCDSAEFNSDHTILELWDSYRTSYIREDKYDAYKAALENKLEYYFLVYSEYPDGYKSIDSPEYNVVQKNILLDDETTAMINRTLSISGDRKVKYTDIDEPDRSSTKMIRVNPCDKNLYVMNGNVNIYLIKDYSRNYYIWNGNTYNDHSICPVSEEDVSIIDELFKNHKSAVDDTSTLRGMFENYEDYNGNSYNSDTGSGSETPV